MSEKGDLADCGGKVRDLVMESGLGWLGQCGKNKVLWLGRQRGR